MPSNKQSRAARVSATLVFLLTPDSTALLTLAVGLLTACLFTLSSGADGLVYPSEVEMEAVSYFGPEAAITKPGAAGAAATQSGADSAPTGTITAHSSSKERKS